MLTRVVPAAWLERVMNDALAARDVAPSHRREVVEGVLFASARGLETHGVPLFRTYLDELALGRAKLKPRFRYTQRRAAIAHLDADGALGIVAAHEATRTATRLAQTNGIGAVVVANSNHFGAASIYTEAMSREGLVGLALSNSDALVVPANGRAPRLGTNPISMAAQGEGSDLFCADLATSQGSFLRSLAMRASGHALPAGVLVDDDGQDAAHSGGEPTALLPLGGHKGQCLGMMVSILCALLAGEPFDWELPNLFEGPFDQPRRIAHLMLAIDVSAVADADTFRSRLSQYLQAFRDTPARPGTQVAAPGDDEASVARTRAREGIPIAGRDYDFLCGLEAAAGDGHEGRALP